MVKKLIMKTFNELLDTVIGEEGYVCVDHFFKSADSDTIEFFVNFTAIEFAKQACEAQRHICLSMATIATKGDEDYDFDYPVISKNSILNAFTPSFY